MISVNVSADSVHIAGSFQSEAGYFTDWHPGITVMSDTNGDQIYSLTVFIPAGTYHYKFINGNTWDKSENAPAECTINAFSDREIVVGPGGKVIPTVRFNECPPTLVFSVNMNGWPVSPQGIHVMGDFQQAAGFANNWDPTSIKLEDLNQDGYYEKKIIVPEGNYKYLFVNGNTQAGKENIPVICSVSDGTSIPKRNAIVNSGGSFPLWNCFNTCGSCYPPDTASGVRGPWNDDVFYEIFVRSFYDSNNDGIGDFKGIIKKLDYLNDGNPNTKTDLGVKGIWLMPIMKSPSYHGYDVTDYYATEPDYGTMADFQELLDSAHKRGIKVILDLVINHTSSQHPWFTQSVNSQNGYRDWYVWKNTNPGFTGPWGQQVWHLRNGKYYYGLFTNAMPDLNFNLPAVKQEVFNISTFWLNKGVDGFRLDAAQYLVENGQQLAGAQGTYDFLTEFKDHCKNINPDCFNVGEVWAPTSTIVPYIQNQKLDACFEFDLADRIVNSVAAENPASILNQMNIIKQSYPDVSYATFLTNHDQNRVASLLGQDWKKVKQAASMYLTLPGIPFIYYGEEISMNGGGPDENKRTPMQWSNGLHAGFSTVTPWQPIQPNTQYNNVATMSSDPTSALSHYRNLIHLRNNNAVLRKGIYKQLINFNQSLIAYARVLQQDLVLVISNFSDFSKIPVIGLESSTILPGTYFVTDLLTNTSKGIIDIDANGGFQNWSAPTGTPLTDNQTWILSLSVENPVGVKSPAQTLEGLSIYPNPAKDRVYIEGLESLEFPEFTILDGQGREIWKGHPEADRGIPIQKFPQGMYLLKIRSGSDYRMEKLMIGN